MGMLGVVSLVLLAAVVDARIRLSYAGFDHVLAFRSEDMSVSAYDYRRSFSSQATTCDTFAQPPLVQDFHMQDWISEGLRKSNGHEFASFRYLGYELFMVSNDVTGSYVIRRCRDFRPQLDALPCESFATGSTNLMNFPQRLAYIGNNRVMSIDVATGDFSVYPFDADVHSGGDPFHSFEGPLLVGSFPMDLSLFRNATFDYIQLPRNLGDMVLVHLPDVNIVSGYQFNGMAKAASDVNLHLALQMKVEPGVLVATIGENQFMVYDQQLNYKIYTVARNATSPRFQALLSRAGNLQQGHACSEGTATSCVLTQGCAWCPTTRTCHGFDYASNSFCDNHVCADGPITEKAPASVFEDEIREVVENPHEMQLTDDDDLLPGDLRLPGALYRNKIGAYANARAAPLNPLLDAELGDPVESFPHINDIIDEQNKVNRGIVYHPPDASASSPCMDSGYNLAAAADNVDVSSQSMNGPIVAARVETFVSPAGDAEVAPPSDCPRSVAQAADGPNEEFAPPSTNPAAVPNDYSPQSRTPRQEQDTMNFDLTQYSRMAAGDNGPLILPNDDLVDGPLQYPPFQPPEDYGAPMDVAPAPVVPDPALRVSNDATDLMNQGVPSYCSDDAPSIDGFTTPVFEAAMGNAQENAPAAGGMPKTIPQLLQTTATFVAPNSGSLPNELPEGLAPPVAFEPSPSPWSSWTSSNSLTPSLTSMPSLSPSTTPVASPSVTPTNTPGPSSSPSVSPMFQVSVSIGDVSSVCPEGKCLGIDSTIRDSVAAKAAQGYVVVGLITTISHIAPYSFSSMCDNSTINPATMEMRCVRTIPVTAITNRLDAAMGIDIFIQRRENKGFYQRLPPPLLQPFDYAAPLDPPNLFMKKTGIFGVIDCTRFVEESDIVVAWPKPQLCWDDAYFGRNICVDGSTGLSAMEDGQTYVNARGEALDPMVLHKKFVCQGQVGSPLKPQMPLCVGAGPRASSAWCKSDSQCLSCKCLRQMDGTAVCA